MSAAGGGGYVLEPGRGRPIDLGGFSMTVKATAHETDGTFTLLEAAEPPHFGPPLHIHHGIGEAFYVLEGEHIYDWRRHGTYQPAGEIRRAVEGFIPRYTQVQWTSACRQPAHLSVQ